MKHRWRVGVMSEMAPEGYVGISSVCVLGYNKVLLAIRNVFIILCILFVVLLVFFIYVNSTWSL